MRQGGLMAGKGLSTCATLPSGARRRFPPLLCSDIRKEPAPRALMLGVVVEPAVPVGIRHRQPQSAYPGEKVNWGEDAEPE